MVHFKPSSKYLEETEFDEKRIRTMLQEFSFLCKRLSFSFSYYKGKQKRIDKFYSTKGLSDYLDYLNDGKKLYSKPFYIEESNGNFKVEIAFCYNSGYSGITRLYTNNIPQTKGTHLTGFKMAFTKYMNSVAKEQKWSKGEPLVFNDFEEGLVLIINFRMIDPVFKGQNKEELSSSEGRIYVKELTQKGLEKIDKKQLKYLKLIYTKAAKAKEAKEAAKKAKDAVRELGKKSSEKGFVNMPTKLVDAYGKDRTSCELFIVEGDSAASGLIGARDGMTQAIFPIRGKLINFYKNSDDKIFKNQEVNNIVKALGLEFDLETRKIKYNKNRLRYGKIILCCDAKKIRLAV
jgi:DNA gyrase subunit B